MNLFNFFGFKTQRELELEKLEALELEQVNSALEDSQKKLAKDLILFASMLLTMASNHLKNNDVSIKIVSTPKSTLNTSR